MIFWRRLPQDDNYAETCGSIVIEMVYRLCICWCYLKVNKTGNVLINVTLRCVRATTVAMRMRHIVICDLPRSTIFFQIIS